MTADSTLHVYFRLAGWNLIGSAATLSECVAICEADGQLLYEIHDRDGIMFHWTAREGVTIARYLSRAEKLRFHRERCADRVAVETVRRGGSHPCMEFGTSAHVRCRQKTPANWGAHDPRASRWLLSGGDPRVLGCCNSDCPTLGAA